VSKEAFIQPLQGPFRVVDQRRLYPPVSPGAIQIEALRANNSSEGNLGKEQLEKGGEPEQPCKA